MGDPIIAVIMGVSGAGKTTIGLLLAQALGCGFQDGDALHPAENIEKMRRGSALTDADRGPWLRRIAEEIDAWHRRSVSGVMACSALKRAYRDAIVGQRGWVTLIYLKASYDLVHRRMVSRHEHFMPVALLDSQFATLEEPTPDEHAITVDVSEMPADVTRIIMRELERRS